MRRLLAARATRRAALLGSSCSQTLTTRQPANWRSRSVSRSRFTFAASFFRHHSAFARGNVACIGQPCQKHPSTMTATLAFVKTRSPRRRVPGSGKSTRYLSPRRWTAERSSSSHRVSRCFVERMRLRAEGDDARGRDIRRRYSGTSVRTAGRAGGRPCRNGRHRPAAEPEDL